MAVQYHSVVDYLIMHLLLDIEAGSHFPPHLTAEESGAQEIQKSQGLAKKADIHLRREPSGPVVSGLRSLEQVWAERQAPERELLPARAGEPSAPANAYRKPRFHARN